MSITMAKRRPGRKREYADHRALDLKLGRDGAGRDRLARVARRAAYETERNRATGRDRAFVSRADIIRRAVDLYLSAYPPPGEHAVVNITEED